MHRTRYGNRPQEEVVDLFSDEGTQTQKFAVDSMQNRLQKVSFPEDQVFTCTIGRVDFEKFSKVANGHSGFSVCYTN